MPAETRFRTSPRRGLLLAALALAALPRAGGAAEDVNRVVLRVNDQILTLYDFEQRKSAELTSLLSDPRLAPADRQERVSRLGQEVMKEAFREMLLTSRADQLHIQVDDAQVDAAVQEVRNRQGLTADEDFHRALEAAGLSEERMRENLRREIEISQVMGKEVWGEIKIGDEDLKAYYRNNADEFRIPEERHLEEVIVLEASGLDREALRRVAEEIHARLTAGDPFPEVVAPYAEKGTTSEVVDLGWLRAEELAEELKDGAWALAPGDYSPPIAGRGGLHILHLLELQEAKLPPFSEVENKIRSTLRSARFSKDFRAYVGKLEKRAYVAEDLPPDAVGYRNLFDDYQEEQEFDFFGAPIQPLGDEKPPVADTAGPAGSAGS